MSDIAGKLIDFFVAKAPVSAWPFQNMAARLPAGYPAGSKLHFILDLATKDPDSAVRGAGRLPLPIRPEDREALRSAHDAAWKAFRTGDFDQADMMTVATLPPLVVRMAEGYALRSAEAAAQMAVLEKKLREHRARHRDLLARKDYSSLADDYYPNMSTILCSRTWGLDGEALPPKGAKVVSLLRRTRVEALRREMEAPRPLVVQPEVIADLELLAARYRVCGQQDQIVIGASQDIAMELSRLVAAPKAVAQIIPFPEPK